MGVNITHVPYRGAGPVIQDLIAGRIDYMCDTIQTGATQAKAGSVKPLAVMAPKRVSIIPDLPTTGEQGLPGVEATVWNAFFLPKGTPEPIVRRLNQAVGQMLDDPTMRKRLEDLGLDVVPPEQRSPEYLAKFLPEDIARWAQGDQGGGDHRRMTDAHALVSRAQRSATRKRRPETQKPSAGGSSIARCTSAQVRAAAPHPGHATAPHVPALGS